MRILYGLCGEGMGHATRSKVVIDHLLSRGHDVLCAASDQALRVLSSDPAAGGACVIPPSASAPGGSFTQDANRSAEPQGVARRDLRSPQGVARSRLGALRVLPIVGLGMRCVDGGLDLRGSIEENAQRLPDMLRVNSSAWTEAEAFRPDAVITDYDSFAWLFSGAHGLPLVSIDNAQVLPRCLHRPEVLGPYADGMAALEAFTTMKAPDARHYIVTTFFYPRVKPGLESSTTLVPPVLRPEVLALLRAGTHPRDLRSLDSGDGRAAEGREEGGYVLLYKTSSLDDAAFLKPAGAIPDQRFVAYGFKGAGPVPPNVEIRPYDTAAFLRDVAGARAIVGNGGMSLMGEALAFGKPVYAVPVRGQYEQVMNASYLRQLGYGVTSDVLDPDVLRGFLRNLRLHQAIIRAQPQHDENRALYTTLDRLFGTAR